MSSCARVIQQSPQSPELPIYSSPLKSPSIIHKTSMPPFSPTNKCIHKVPVSTKKSCKKRVSISPIVQVKFFEKDTSDIKKKDKTKILTSTAAVEKVKKLLPEKLRVPIQTVDDAITEVIHQKDSHEELSKEEFVNKVITLLKNRNIPISNSDMKTIDDGYEKVYSAH
jgi:hypothetical protein